MTLQRASGLACHAVAPGSLFVCVPGQRADGHDFAADAVAAGAVALVVERRLDLSRSQVSKLIQGLNVPAIHAVQRIYERGVEQGVFRPGLDPVDLHMSISAMSFFNVSNRYTFALIFKRDFDDPQTIARRRDTIVETLVRFVRL